MAIEIVDFRPMDKNTLRGFVTIRMTQIGLEIRDVALHEKNGQRWIQLPSRPYTGRDGTTKYSYILDFYDKPMRDRFTAAVLKALETR